MLYIGVNPIIDAPNWCLQGLKDTERTGIVLECSHMGIPFSRNPTLSPGFIAALDLMCLCFFLYFRWFKTKWEKKRKTTSIKNWIMTITIALIFIDNIVAMIIYIRPFFSIMMRPLIVACFLHLVRQNCRHFYNDVKDSASILVVIFLFILLYSITGTFLFHSS